MLQATEPPSQGCSCSSSCEVILRVNAGGTCEHRAVTPAHRSWSPKSVQVGVDPAYLCHHWSIYFAYKEGPSLLISCQVVPLACFHSVIVRGSALLKILDHFSDVTFSTVLTTRAYYASSQRASVTWGTADFHFMPITCPVLLFPSNGTAHLINTTQRQCSLVGRVQPLRLDVPCLNLGSTPS